MSFETPITKETLDEYLKALAKEFRKLNGTKTSAEIILVGGAAILANYGFRDMTYDVDAVILASSAMKDAIIRVGDRLGLPTAWLNADFRKTKSYSGKLLEVSVYYKTFSNILTIRTVAAEYLVAMKLMSGRRYKNDISDIYGILSEHQRTGTPIPKSAVETAIRALYGDNAELPEQSARLLEEAYANGDFERLYNQSREDEIEAKQILLKFENDYPNTLKTEDIDSVLEQMKQKRGQH